MVGTNRNIGRTEGREESVRRQRVIKMEQRAKRCREMEEERKTQYRRRESAGEGEKRAEESVTGGPWGPILGQGLSGSVYHIVIPVIDHRFVTLGLRRFV